MHEHLTRELFRAVSSGWRDPGDLAAVALAHLFELCPICRKESEVWRSELEKGGVWVGGGDHDALVDRLGASDSVTEGDAAAEQGRLKARSRVEELLVLPPEQQADWIRSEARKSSGELLAEALIEHCRRRTPGDPHAGVAFANLARLVLQHAPTSARATQLYARALAYLANAVRVVGDLPRADQILGDARYFLVSQGGGDRLLRAELDSLEGSLRNDQSRASEAVPVLLRALMTQRLERDRLAAAASLIKLAKAHGLLGADQRSLQLLSEAEWELEEDAELRLVLLVRESAANYLRAGGEPEQGKEVFARTEALAEKLGDPLHLFLRSWCKARVHAALGDPDTAESLFLQARDGFAGMRVLYKLALVSLDLAELYSREGRDQEAADLLDVTLPIFQERGVYTKVQQAHALLGRVSRR